MQSVPPAEAAPGLSERDVVAARQRHGSNRLTPPPRAGLWAKFLGNLRDPLIGILLVALGIILTLSAFGYAEWLEAVGIAVAVAIATWVATLSEHRSENAFQALLAEASRMRVKVYRDSQPQERDIEELVVGDAVWLQAGDKVPADGRLVEGRLVLDEAALTGESTPKLRSAGEGEDETVTLQRGAVVLEGSGQMFVERVGDATRYGRIAQSLHGAGRLSPLQLKLGRLAGRISRLGTIGAVAIAAAFLFKHAVLDTGFQAEAMAAYLADGLTLVRDAVEAAILAIIIIVVAVPEGLPMMVAIVLAANMSRLRRDHVLVRKLLGIEAAGSLDLLYTDKTGTLTTGALTLSAVVDGQATVQDPAADGLAPPVARAAARVVQANRQSARGADGVLIGANPTERALVNGFLPRDTGDPRARVLAQRPFTSARQYAIAQLDEPTERGVQTLVMGAPERLLSRCTTALAADGTVQPLDRAGVETALEGLAERSMRLIALAEADTPSDLDASDPLPETLRLVAVAALRDGIRAESPGAVAEAQAAGIQVVMLTGDRRSTAAAIASELGLLDRADALILDSDDLATRSDVELAELLPRLRVIARALPEDKNRLVRVAQWEDRVVGMTGDGVNDAPALSTADVGFAMGSGTEVAKEAGDVVILDDNFASLTRAVLYGRTLFRSIRKFLVFQLTVNLSALLVVFLGPFIGYDFPLTLIQLLWINLIMDTLAALAFAGEPALRRYMHVPPIARGAPLMTPGMTSAIVVGGLGIAGLSLFFLTSPWIEQRFHSHAAYLTGFFAFFVFINNFNKFNARTGRVQLFEHLHQNPMFLIVVTGIVGLQILFTYFGGEVLRTVGLTPMEWAWVLGLSLLILPWDALRKGLQNRVGSGDRQYGP